MIFTGTLTSASARHSSNNTAASPQTTVAAARAAAQPASTTTLVATPKSAAYGSLFTLTATVKSGTTPVANGSVTFYDGAKAIGSAQVVTTTSGGGVVGTATLKTLALPIGANSLTAKYAGANAASTSAAATVTVTGKYPDAATLADSGVQGSYALVGTLFSGGPFSPVATGSIAFKDNSTSQTLGTVALDATTLTQGFVNVGTAVSYTSGSQAVTLADVNGDGKLDLLFGSDVSGFAVQLGNGDGTYQAAQTVAGNTNVGSGNIVAADVNGDGKLDVIVGNQQSAGVFLGNGDGTFQAEVDYDSGVLHVAVGDVNGDGKLDVVTVTSGYSVDVLLGNGDGTFQAPVSAGSGYYYYVGLADFNGDGKLDILATAYQSNCYTCIAVLLGNGDGTFQAGQLAGTVYYYPERLSVADLNGDGKQDVVVEDLYGNLGTMLGNGDGTFQAEQSLEGGQVIRQQAVADVNGDGKPDIIVPDQNQNVVRVYPGNGDGTFGNAVSYATGNAPQWVAVGDINNDGKPDLALVDYYDSTPTILLNRATVTATLTGVTLPGSIADKVTGTYSGDANYSAATTNTLLLPSVPGPGMATLAVSPTSGAEGTLFTLTAKATDGTAITAGSFAFYDGVPTDGDNLIATVQIDAATGAAAYETRSLKIGTHQLYAVFTGTDETKSATAGPVQATVTGKYATTTALASTGVQGSYAFSAVVDAFGLGTPTGSVVFTDESTNTTLGTVPLTAATLTSTFLPPTTLGAGNRPIWAVAGDFNGDGKQDIAVTNYSDSTLYVYLGNGDGSFAAPQGIGLLSSPYALVTGDFNGDGKLDIATTIPYLNGAYAAVLLGNGDGTFQPEQIYAVAGNNDPYPFSIVAADLNGDGKLDLVLGNYQNSPLLSVLLGNGDGTFGAANNFGTRSNNYVGGVTVGDFNRDGKPDIAVSVSNSGGAFAGIFLGVGDGTFGPETDFATGATYYGVLGIAAGDVNLDGKLDLVVGSYNGTVGVLSGNGDGTFNAPQTYSTGAQANQILITDLNGDGNPDLVVSPFETYSLGGDWGPSSVSVFLGNGTAGTFQPPLNVPVAANAVSSVAVADFNGDGRPDLVATQFLNGELSVVLGADVEAVTLSAPTLPGSVSDEVVAAYTGDANFAASVSNTLTLPSHPLATKTALAATPTSAALGAVVTLTATVTDSNSKPVTGGSVSFYNGTTLLQTLPLAAATNGATNAGTATLKLADLPVGANSITAQFAGTVYDTASASAAKTVTITGKYPTTTALTVAGTSGNYNLTGTVTSGAIANPTGSVVFTDTTASPNVVLGTVSLAGAASTSTFLPPTTLGTDSYPVWVVTGDFNGDGKLDIAVAARYYGTVDVYLGNGDGTFVESPTSASVGGYEACLVAGDFNGDGKLDLAVATNNNAGYAGVLIGNGDGTFQAAQFYAVGNGNSPYPQSIAAADLNGDGKLDLVVGNSQGGAMLSVLLGNGDGTFGAANNFGSGSNNSVGGVAVGDFNRDGKPDIAVSVSNSGGAFAGIFLGVGDGTFGEETDFAGGSANGVLGIASGDVNLDGKLDLVVGSYNGVVSVLSGNGDGTFNAPQTYSTGAAANQIVIADVNGDGNPDLVVSDFQTYSFGGYDGPSSVSVFLGNGTAGTLQPATNVSVAADGAGSVGVADFNGDGRLDIVSTNFENNELSVVLGATTEGVTLTNAAVFGSGSSLHNVVATYSGDTHFTGSTSPAQQLTASPPPVTLTLADEPGASEPYGTAASVLATVAGPAGAPTPTGSVSYTVDGGAAQAATLSGGSATLALGSALSVAKHTIAAIYSGDTIYGKVTQSISLTIVKANQTVSFNNTIGNQTYGAGPFGVSATATSGLAATVSVVSGPATISGTTLTLTGAGTVVLQAAQAGNADYNAAPTVQQSFTVAKAPLAVVVANATKVYGNPNPPFSATITGLVGTDKVTATLATPATPTSPVGTYSITATLSGAALANYTPTITPGTLTITKQPLTVTVANASRNYGAANPAFSATITGLQGSDTATATGATTATATSPVGAYSITATVTGSDLGNYNVTVVNGTLTVAPAPLTITVANATKVYGQANPVFTYQNLTGVENGDTIPITYSTTATTMSPVVTGGYPITASTTDANYVATVVNGTLTITQAPLTIMVNSFSKIYGSANPPLTGVITGVLPSDINNVVGVYTSTAVQYSYVGAYPITATISGSAAGNYSIATNTPGTLTVTQALLTIVVNNGTKVYGMANPAFTGTVTGILNNDAVVTTYSSPATKATTVGSYANIGAAISGGPAVNYKTKVTDGTLTITPAPLTATVNPATKTYGAANPAFATTFAGLVNGDTLTSTYTTSATAASPVGSYSVTVALSGALLPNYTPTLNAGTLTVTKATLTVTANNASAVYGAAIPPLTDTITGFVNSDPASVVSGAAAETTTAVVGSVAGSYPITVAAGTLAATNYTFSFVAGTLTITQESSSTSLSTTTTTAVPFGSTVSFTAHVTGVYGTPTGTVNFLAGGASLGTEAVNASGVATLSTTALPAGTDAVTASYGGDANFSASVSSPVAVTVTPPAAASVPSYGAGFSTTGLALNGGASVKGTILQVTDGGKNEAHSAFFTTPVNVQAFTTDFDFEEVKATADGFAFVIQNQGTTAVGSSGGGLGYGLPPTGTGASIGKSVAVKFDIYSNSGEGTDSTGVYLNGASPTLPATDLSASGVVLKSGDEIHAHIAYDGINLTLTLTDTVTKATVTETYPVNIPATVGGPTAYVGFTGGTGGSSSTQEILDWSYAVTTPAYSSGFTASGMTLNGGATVAGALLKLTDGGKNEARSAFFNDPVNVQAFTTDFDFQDLSATADGFTFTIQNQGPTAVGSSGGGLGYGVPPIGTGASIGKSVAVKFDIYSNSGEGTDSTGVYTDGASPTLPATDLSASGVVFRSGHVFHAHIVYDGSTLSLTLTDATTQATVSEAYPVNIPATVGGNTAYIGFTGGTGGSSSTQEILDWSYGATAPPATPTAAPSITPGTASYAGPVPVTIADATSGATIYYTLDGSTPTAASAVYTAPITVNATTTIQAIAQAAGYIPSSVSSATLTIQSPAAAYPTGFANTSGLVLNGGAKISGTLLQLTDGGENEARSAFFSAPVNVQAFTTDFDFQELAAAADGFTFVIQNQGLNALGSVGGGLGYGMPPTGAGASIGESVAIKFDIANNSGEGTDSTGLYTDGASPTLPATDLTSSGVVLKSGDVIHAHIAYDGANLSLTLTDATANKTASVTYPVNIPAVVGGNTAYVGFTGGAGHSSSVQDILDWTYAPATAPAYASGFTAQGLTLNGGAAVKGTALQLTDGGAREARSAFYNLPVNVQGFTTDFDFQDVAATADGFTFTIQNRGLTALGTNGAGLGYGVQPNGTGASIGKSVAVKFDIYSNSGEGTDSTGVYLNGASPTLPSTDLSASGVNFRSGHAIHAHIVYDGTTLALTLTDAASSATVSESYPVDIPSAVGGNTAYVGFTGGAGGSSSTQNVLDWTYTPGS